MKHTRPRSADLGGLHLATEGSGFGQGWLGYSGEMQTRFAELLTSMYTETSNVVNERDVEFAPTDLPAETRTRLIYSLDSWSFEPHRLPDEEALACTMMLFEALFRIEHMQHSLGLSLKDQIYPLIHHLRRIYRWENTYHNFEHALDVLQCSYIFLRSAGMVPPVSILLDQDPGCSWTSRRQFDSGPLITCLGLKELFVVYIVAIGHDVAHPGFTNLFMKNAETPLSMVYDGKSALEQMHCSLLLRVMRHYGLGPLLDGNGSGCQSVKKLLSETVLVTDMSVHERFMKSFKSLVHDDLTEPTREGRIVKEGEGQLWRRQVLVCQALMKCADISNPFRPYHVSQHWAAALMGEWTSQAMLERCMDLPCTVQCSDDPLSEANGQVFFIDTFAKPLLQLVNEAIPELQPHLDQCNDNLQLWKSRQIDLKSAAITTAVIPIPELSPALSSSSSTSIPPSPMHRDDYLTAFPLALPKHHPYRNVAHDMQMHYSIENDDNKEESVLHSDIKRAKDDVNDNELQTNSLTPHSSSSAATSVTLFWPPSSATIMQKGYMPTLAPTTPSSRTTLPSLSSPSTSASENATASLSTPSSPRESDSGTDSEYMSAAEWSSTGGGDHDASSYRTTANRGSDRFCGNGSSGNASHHSRSPLESSGASSANGAAYMYNSLSTYLPDPHAGLRAAADSGRPMLRKQRSMLNRKSWGAPGEYTYPRAGANAVLDDGIDRYSPYTGSIATSSMLSVHTSSLPPPPLSSPPDLGHGLGHMGFGSLVASIGDPSPPVSVSVVVTPEGLSQPTILVAEPHPHVREV